MIVFIYFYCMPLVYCHTLHQSLFYSFSTSLMAFYYNLSASHKRLLKCGLFLFLSNSAIFSNLCYLCPTHATQRECVKTLVLKASFWPYQLHQHELQQHLLRDITFKVLISEMFKNIMLGMNSENASFLKMYFLGQKQILHHILFIRMHLFTTSCNL